MAEKFIKNEMTEISIKHRAICEDDSYRGKWRKDVDEAYRDARNHRNKPGNQFHVTRIITQQND